MRKVLASLVLALSFTITTLTVAPTASATLTARLDVTDNKREFNSRQHGPFVITTTARHETGKRMHGKARLYINGHHLRTRDLHHGAIRFQLDRSRIPNNRDVRIKVRIMPWNPKIRDRVVVRTIRDRPPERASSVVTVARQQIGDPYRYGGAGPNSFDCSGLVQYAYRHATGKRLPHSSSAIRNAGNRVSSPRAGDVVWTPGHVSIYVGGGKVVEAAKPGTRVRLIERWQKDPTYLRF